MERTYPNEAQALNVAHEAMWLAYSAAGLGFLHDRPGITRDQVIAATFREGEGYADYCFGRMMKTSIRAAGSTVRTDGGKPRGAYQSWAYAYPTYEALLDAAEASLAQAEAA